MPRILYISYTGLLDPLGESQVLQYVLRLARNHKVTVLSFEKPATLADHQRVHRLVDQCEKAGVEWHQLLYHNRPSVPATLYDIAAGVRKAIKLARMKGTQVVHTRSYIPGMIGAVVKHRTGARLIFDMRGFWPDERVDGGIWKGNSMRYRAFKWIERHLFLRADHVVSLTHAGKREIEKFDYLQGRMPPISVIPTCTNLEIFKPMPREKGSSEGFTLGYVGSAGSWYMFAEVAQVVRKLFEMHADARFLIINKGDHEAIRRILSESGVDLDRVEIRSAPFSDVALQIARMDAGIFFYRPTWSKTATSPTRLGEFLACGKPVLANIGIGDVADTLNETGTGVAINKFDSDTLGRGLEKIVALADAKGISQRCRKAAEERYSLDAGVTEYSRIYESLTAGRTEADGGASD